MSLAHLTLPTREVEKTASFLEQTLGYVRDPVPENVPDETVWLNIDRGQQIHVFFVDGFEVSPFEQEFGRHVAVFHPLEDFAALQGTAAAARRRAHRAAPPHTVRALLLPRADQRLRLRSDRSGARGTLRMTFTQRYPLASHFDQ